MIQLNRSHFLLSVAAWSGMLQFVVCVYFAMQLFADGYSLGQNFLSDLGRTVSLASRQSNPSCLLFNVSVVVLGTSLLGFFALVPSETNEGQWYVRLPGIMSATGIVGIGLTPYDVLFVPHILALVLWLAPMVVLLIAHVVSSATSNRGSSVTRWLALATICAVLGYAIAGSHNGYVFMQKITASLAIVWFLAIASPFSPVYRATMNYVSQRRVLAEKQAMKYMKLLERGYRLPCEAPKPPGS
ncbi:MAG: hypothetical protein NT013_20085 [Planctomycetia bacterium]|nr:hypothetical protein [Planctomycetia bacterium]